MILKGDLCFLYGSLTISIGAHQAPQYLPVAYKGSLRNRSTDFYGLASPD